MDEAFAAYRVWIVQSIGVARGEDSRMPQPKQIDGRVVWDRFALDEAFTELPDREAKNPWDD